MNILVVGGGYLGKEICERLDELGHDVSLIDALEERTRGISPDFGGVIINSFPMDINNLKTAGIETCDAVLVTSSDDNLNITIGQIAKNFFNVDKVVSRISDPYREYIFENFGLKTICPTKMAAESMINAIISPYEQKQIGFGTNTVSFKILPAERKSIGKDLLAVDCANNESIFGLIRKDGEFILNSTFMHINVEDEDKIVYAVKVD